LFHEYSSKVHEHISNSTITIIMYIRLEKEEEIFYRINLRILEKWHECNNYFSPEKQIISNN